MRMLEPVTPGELLLEEFLEPMGLSQYRDRSVKRLLAARPGGVRYGSCREDVGGNAEADQAMEQRRRIERPHGRA